MLPSGMRRAWIWVVLLALPLVRAGAEPERVAFGADEVRLPGLAIGRTYSTWHLAQAPVVVQNTSEDTLRVRIRVAVPARHELRSGALPVPDRDWVQVENELLVVPPRSTAHSDVLLSVPYEPDLAGHTYQVDLWSTALEPDGSASKVTQRHRLLFKVEMDYRDDTEIDLAHRSVHPNGLL